MTERVEVKTKAAAEKAIKTGKPIRIVAGTFALTLSSFSGSIQIEGSASVQFILNSSSPRIEARGTSSPTIVAWGTSSPTIVARGTSSPTIVASETSSPTIVASETSSPRIEARETSSPTIEAWGTSSPRIVASETSSPRIEARETSSPTIVARGYSMIQASGNVTGTAEANVSINLRNGGNIQGGKQTVIALETPTDWCNYYGARIDGEYAIVYKAVGEGYRSAWGVTYAPGTMPKDEAWDGRKRECSAGGGLNFSPTPRHTHEFVTNPDHYLECRVRLDEMVCHWGGSYPQKICSREVAAPLIEVDVEGVPLPTEQAA